jgi:hypothetical protein
MTLRRQGAVWLFENWIIPARRQAGEFIWNLRFDDWNDGFYLEILK